MRTILLWIALLVTAIPATASAQQEFDILIRGGRVLDGSGNPWYYADVGIRGDRIVAVGDLSSGRARRTIDATGLYVAPGFIDAHSHAGGGLATAQLSHAQPLLAQGITTVLVNPDGGGSVDIARQRTALLAHGLGVNVAQLVPHGSVRGEVLGSADRDPTPAEMDRMRALVRAGMEAGAFGLSSGPFYAPGSFSKTEELVELAKVAAAFGGAYTSHIRDEGDYTVGVVAAVDEVIRVAREAELPGVVTHIKVLGPRVWGYSSALVHRIERAREEGVEVFADQYPYAASATSLTAALIPRWAQAGGAAELRRRLTEPAERARVLPEILDNLDRRGGADRIQFRRYAPDTTLDGKTLQFAVDRSGKPVEEVVAEMVLAGGAGIVSFNMLESDLAVLMRQPWTMTASDGDLTTFGAGVPHPRSYGTFPRRIRRYVLEQGVVDLGSTIRSMTSLPATVFRIADRGQIRAGAIADVVVFDLATLNDPADYDNPHRLAEGMRHVLVNGRLAIDEGQFSADLHGVVLSRRGTVGR
jgi:N-acyl-D-amino-acid deacylase